MSLCKTKACRKIVHAKGLCQTHYRKEWYALNRDSHKKYEKTLSGFIMRMYRNMKSRVMGVQKNKNHLYKGKYLLSKEDFYAMAHEHPKFKELFVQYVLSGYQRKFAPSIDRINPDVGYTISNMEWVTQSENSRRSSITRKRFK